MPGLLLKDVSLLQIGFLGPGDPTDVRSYSGVPYFAFRELKRRHSDIVHIDVGDQSLSKLAMRLNRGALRLTGRKVLASEPTFRLRKAARDADRQIEAASLDAVICLNVDFLIAFLQCKTPIIHNSDTTFAAIADYYENYKTLSGVSRRRAMSLTQTALARANGHSFPSEWARKSGIDAYNINPKNAHVIPYGANLSEPPQRSDATGRVAGGTVRFLFIGGDWERKGGPLAYQTMLNLIEQGIDASISIVGAKPDIDHPKLRKLGFLNKQIPDDLSLYNQLWRDASFLFMPTQQETFGAIYSEAAANGVPVIACETGGVGSCVIDGATGRLLDFASTPDQFAKAIVDIWNDPNVYSAMSNAARDRYETVLNWGTWADHMLDLVKATAGK
ncbi:MAG: glycosyltransferase family 4 protein [Aliishimia sp.]